MKVRIFENHIKINVLFMIFFTLKVVFQDLKPTKWPCIPTEIFKAVMACMHSSPDIREELQQIRMSIEEYLSDRNTGKIYRILISNSNSLSISYKWIEWKKASLTVRSKNGMIIVDCDYYEKMWYDCLRDNSPP